jgi:hypothetical protein
VRAGLLSRPEQETKIVLDVQGLEAMRKRSQLTE